MNKRIRAEEMLRTANYPGFMAARERSRLSTPAAHSDLPIDPSPAVPSSTSSERERRCASPVKKKRDKDEFITTSPQPFKFNTAERAAKKVWKICSACVLFYSIELIIKTNNLRTLRRYLLIERINANTIYFSYKRHQTRPTHCKAVAKVTLHFVCV